MNNNIPENVVQLHKASGLGNLGRVQALLAQGLDPNSKDGVGWTPLMCSRVSRRPCRNVSWNKTLECYKQ